MRILAMLLFGNMVLLSSCGGQTKDTPEKDKTDNEVVSRSEAEWKEVLTPEQFHILREKGTDRPFTGKYYKTSENGVYSCAACGNELFTSDMKFDSDCGWPSFDKAMEGGKIKTAVDRSYGMIRTEIMCARCGGHLGHLFEDGPTETGLRYCVNSTSLNFVREK
ncbi:MAG TPA: peptide-methionine (R)-S-oxide reductase MsrB [Ohtaekwangia sp.]|nr:peptide-methionine (R)-S-oxide reductase MsrB [Ohtaekwangia sp.]